MATRLTECSATELAQLIRDGTITAVEVMDAHLAAIDRLNPKLNAIVAVAADAREQAAAHDRALARGDRIGPLHGVPFTAKDIIETAALPTTLGMVELADNRPARDATVVARMRSSGAILLGKTNCPRGGPEASPTMSSTGGRSIRTTPAGHRVVAAEERRPRSRRACRRAVSAVTRAEACGCRLTSAASRR